MKLIYLGKELDSNLEHELETTSKFGFDVIITFKKDCEFHKLYNYNKNVIQKIYNFTEVHNKFESTLYRLINKPQIAFESNIHCTGFNHSIDDIESVEIVLSKRLRKKYIKSNV